MLCPKCGKAPCECPSKQQKTEGVCRLLEPLIAQAEREGKWLQSYYLKIPFSPKELRAENAKGNYLWGPVNWRLIDPKSLLKDAEAAKRQAESHNEEIRKRMS